MYHVDDSPAGIPSADALEQRSVVSQDPICCLTATEKLLIVARESGLIQRYTLPSIAITNRYSIATKPHKMEVNCNST
jgi:WD repeat-containing protein 35